MNVHDIKIGKVTDINVEFIEDILYYEGSILSRYEDEDGRMYLSYFIGREEEAKKIVYLLFELQLPYLNAYYAGNATLYELITLYGEKGGYLVWYNYEGQKEKSHEVNISDIENKWLPEKDSWYNDTFKPEKE